MAVAVKPDPFSSVYVLDAHFQNGVPGMIDVFNSQAGRAVVQGGSPKRKSPAKTKRRQGNDVTKLILNEEQRFMGWQNEKNNFLCMVPCVNGKAGGDDSVLCDIIVDTDENRNIKSNARLTRRIVHGSEAVEDLLPEAEAEAKNEDARIDEKILRLKNHYERGFAADEKCDILRRMLAGFLSGLMFTKTKGRSKWRKRKSSDDLYREASMVLGIPCEMTDSCRCLECQCNYFDCGDSDSETSSISVNLNECDVEEWPASEATTVEKTSCDVLYYEDEVDRRVAEVPVPEDSQYTCPVAQPPQEDPPSEGKSGEVVIEVPPSLEMAASTPVVLDHLLSTPVSCTLQ